MMGTAVVLVHATPKLVTGYYGGDPVRGVEIIHRTVSRLLSFLSVVRTALELSLNMKFLSRSAESLLF